MLRIEVTEDKLDEMAQPEWGCARDTALGGVDRHVRSRVLGRGGTHIKVKADGAREHDVRGMAVVVTFHQITYVEGRDVSAGQWIRAGHISQAVLIDLVPGELIADL